MPKPRQVFWVFVGRLMRQSQHLEDSGKVDEEQSGSNTQTLHFDK
jgi:hypothetical protein